MVILTAYDRLLARRTVSLGAVLTLLALALMFGTDDASSTFAVPFTSMSYILCSSRIGLRTKARCTSASCPVRCRPMSGSRT